MGDWCDEPEPRNLLGGDRVVWVKGINFEGRQEAIKDALRAGRSRLPSAKNVRTYASVVRDRSNAHDPNACAVYMAGQQVGYLPHELAAIVAPILDTFDDAPACRAVVRRIEDGKRLVALVGPWSDRDYADGYIADALEEADEPTVRADWTAALGGTGSAVPHAAPPAQAWTPPPHAYPQHAHAYPQHGHAHAQHGYAPATGIASPRPRRTLTGCLAVVLGVLLFGGCAVGACAILVGSGSSKPPVDAATDGAIDAGEAAPTPTLSVDDLPTASPKPKPKP